MYGDDTVPAAGPGIYGNEGSAVGMYGSESAAGTPIASDPTLDAAGPTPAAGDPALSAVGAPPAAGLPAAGPPGSASPGDQGNESNVSDGAYIDMEGLARDVLAE